VSDLSYLYLHRNPDSIANDYITEIIKEYQLDNLARSNINTGASSSFRIRFTNDGYISIHIWCKRLLLKYVMLYWKVSGNQFDRQLIFGTPFKKMKFVTFYYFKVYLILRRVEGKRRDNPIFTWYYERMKNETTNITANVSCIISNPWSQIVLYQSNSIGAMKKTKAKKYAGPLFSHPLEQYLRKDKELWRLFWVDHQQRSLACGWRGWSWLFSRGTLKFEENWILFFHR
jgi:hypothetical protein